MFNETNATSDPTPAVNEGFTQGGDLTLRSTDGVDFSVHSILLSLASPVFADLLATDNKSEVVRFSEQGEVLALMLKFIYPKPTPIIPSMELFNDALRVAKKYQLENMTTRLREQIFLSESPVSAQAAPLDALFIASTHGFTTEADLAAKLVSKKYDFSKLDDFKMLLNAAPSPAIGAVIGLTGVPLIKTRLLMDVLFDFRSSPMHPGSNIDSLVCSFCREVYNNTSQRNTPEWQVRWARWIFDSVRNCPIADWKGFFSISNLHTAFYQPGLPSTVYFYANGQYKATCICMDNLLGPHSKFQPWADGVYEHLKSRLAFIAEIEDQKYGDRSGAKKE